MNKEDLKKYYCEECDSYYNEPSKFTENRSPLGEKGDSSWLEHLEGCPVCHNGLEVKYYCPRCEKFKDDIEYYPYAEELMCDDCHDEMMKIGELVEKEMERIAENEEI